MIIARSVRAFLNLQAGVTRSEIVPPWLAQADQNRGLEEARRELAGQDRELDEGQLFGRLYHNWAGEKHFESKQFILGGPQKESWLTSVRSFVLSEANA